MYKRLCVFLVIAACLALTSGANADLVSHWQFTEGSGTTTADSVTPTLIGNVSAAWAAGHPGLGGGAVDCAAGTVNVGYPAFYAGITSELSISLWENGNATMSGINDAMLNYTPQSITIIELTAAGTLQWTATDGSWADTIFSSVLDPSEYKGQWNNWVFTKNATTGKMTIYVNGVVKGSAVGKTKVMSGVPSIAIGNYIGRFNGRLADIRFYNNELTANEVGVLYAMGLSNANNPSPKNNQVYVAVPATLSWRAGNQAASHQVYFGTDQSVVSTATTGYTSTTELSFDPGALALNTTYYWRVDEVNGATTWAGDVWNFTTTDGTVFDPNLDAWYKFNDTPGTLAVDSSKSSLNATVGAACAWVAGHKGDYALGDEGTAIDFQAAGTVTVPASVVANCNKQITIGMWQYGTEGRVAGELLQFSYAASAMISEIAIPTDAGAVLWIASSGWTDQMGSAVLDVEDYRGQWNHYAFTKNADTGIMRIILNGETIAT